jgi:hypothetical protein
VWAKEFEMKTMFYVVLSFLLACVNTGKLSSDDPAPVESVTKEKPVTERPEGAAPHMEHAEQAQAACVKACEQENAMRAVSAEVITADCLSGCTGEHQTLGTKSLE